MVRSILSIAALVCAWTGAYAAPPEGSPIVIGTSHSLVSTVLNEERAINVRVPASYAGSDAKRRYPVLYVLDGGVDQDFLHIAGLGQHGEMSGTFDEFIIVGITTKKRIWELTFPTRDERYVNAYREMGESVEIASGGGSTRFRQYVAEDVIPFVERHYRTSDRRVLMGESLAGLFIVETLLKDPARFDDFIAISPSLWWNREELGNRAAELLARQRLKGKRLYLTIASEGGTMQRAYDGLLRALRSPAAGDLKWVHVDRRGQEHHGSLYHLAALDALRTLFPTPWRPGSPLPWFHIGEVAPLSPAAAADRAIPCTRERARRVPFSELNLDPRKWEAFCILSPLGKTPGAQEYSSNWDRK